MNMSKKASIFKLVNALATSKSYIPRRAGLRNTTAYNHHLSAIKNSRFPESCFRWEKRCRNLIDELFLLNDPLRYKNFAKKKLSRKKLDKNTPIKAAVDELNTKFFDKVMGQNSKFLE